MVEKVQSIRALSLVLQKKGERHSKYTFDLVRIRLQRMIPGNDTDVRSNQNSIAGHHLAERRNNLDLLRRQPNFLVGFTQRSCCKRWVPGIPLTARVSYLSAMGGQIFRPERKDHFRVSVIIGHRNQYPGLGIIQRQLPWRIAGESLGK